MSKKRDKRIRLKDFPPDHAVAAFKKEYYFEAITVLHSWTEKEMRSLFHLCISNKLNIPISEGWDVNEKLSYLPLAHVLFITQQLNKAEYDVLISFNSLRNEVIHRYYLDPYEGSWHEISHVKFTSLFNQTLKIVKDIGYRAECYV